MPQLNAWADYFNKTLSSIVSGCSGQFPVGMDRDRLEAVEDKINSLWLSDSATWPEWLAVMGEYRMEFFKCQTRI